ncbi:MAG: hypothetical protein WDM88_13345 [Galbitalea sp.]
MRIVDSRNFPAAKTVAAALVSVNPGGPARAALAPHRRMAVLHLGQGPDERVRPRRARPRTFNYSGWRRRLRALLPMPTTCRTSADEPLLYLEMFKSDKFSDISLNQWLGLTPHELVKAHLNLDDATLATLNPSKPIIVP